MLINMIDMNFHLKINLNNLSIIHFKLELQKYHFNRSNFLKYSIWAFNRASEKMERLDGP